MPSTKKKTTTKKKVTASQSPSSIKGTDVDWTVAELEKHLPVTRQVIQTLIADNNIQPVREVTFVGRTNPVYPLKQVVEALVEYKMTHPTPSQRKRLVEALRSGTVGANIDGEGKGTKDLNHWKTLHEQEKYEAQRFRNQLKSGELIPATTVQADLRSLFQEFCTIIDGQSHEMKQETKEPRMLAKIEEWVNLSKRALANFRITDKGGGESDD